MVKLSISLSLLLVLLPSLRSHAEESVPGRALRIPLRKRRVLHSPRRHQVEITSHRGMQYHGKSTMNKFLCSSLLRTLLERSRLYVIPSSTGERL